MKSLYSHRFLMYETWKISDFQLGHMVESRVSWKVWRPVSVQIDDPVMFQIKNGLTRELRK